MSFTEHNVNGVIFDTAGTLSVGGVRHAFTTRHGGVSPAPFDSLNLASNRGDREENILENYRRLGAAVGFDASRAVGCRQIHSDLVRVAREEDAGKIRWDERPYDADALITNVPNLPLFAYGTDCCMITVYDPASRSIAAIHAGWRGTASGIVLKALVTMMSLYGADPYTMRAAIGPAIGKCCFETDEDGYCRWYSDGHDAFYITGSYTLAEDGLAYRDDGPVYAAGFDPIPYDPAEDWGDSWMSNWG